MHHQILTAAALVAVLPLAACSIDVQKHNGGRNADVDIRTPTGAVSVRTAVPADGTGLAVYPNAWPSREHGREESADVDIDTAWFGVNVVAAKYESDDDPAKVLDGDFKWNLSANVTVNRNKVLNLDNGVTNERFLTTYTVIKVGQPLA